MDVSALPKLGVGLGFRDQFRGELFLNVAKVDFLEIISDHYLDLTPFKMRELMELAASFTLVPHGINLSLGSAEGLDLKYLERLAALIDKINPPWWSEHICFTQAGGVDIGHLSPLPFTYEMLEVLLENIATVQRYIKTPLILENITYMLTIPGAEMNEAEFISQLVRRSGCGLLLDITNLYINSVNHGYDMMSWLAQLPLDQVVQLHFVGGHWHSDMLIDSHAQATPPEVWELMAEVAQHTQLRGAILERDENIPALPVLLAELAQARQVIGYTATTSSTSLPEVS